MKNISTTICYSMKENDDIDEIIKILEYIKSEHIHREIKVLNKPIIIFKLEESD